MFHQPKKVPTHRIVLVPSGWISDASPRQQGNVENLAKEHRFFFFVGFEMKKIRNAQMLLCF